MHDIGTFADWVAEGAAFGIKAFSAVVVFAIICAACAGVLAIIGRVYGGDTDEKSDIHRG